MRVARRRQRTLDPLACPDAVRSICDKLRARLPDCIPTSEKQLMRFLYSVRHVERRPATDTLRGRPSHWLREKLTEAASVLRGLLERETSGRVSVNSFIGQYIPVLNFPADVAGALSKGEINLHEATQLARLTPERLDATPARARRLRSEVMLAHTLARGSQNALRTRVKEILGEIVTVSGKEMAGVVEKIDELLEIDPSDKRHLFYEELKRFFYAMRDTKPEDIDDDSLDEFMTAADQLSNVIYRIELKRRQREKGARKIQL